MKNQSAIERIREIRDLLGQDKVAAAAERLEEALAIFPRDLTLGLLKGTVLEKTDGAKTAREYYSQLSTTFPASAWPDHRLAKLALDEGNAHLAEQHASIAEKRGLNPAHLYEQRARIAGAKNDHAARLAFLEKRVALEDRPNADLLLRLAGARANVGDLAGALELQERALAADGENGKAHLLIARTAIDVGDAERAEKAFSALATLEPDNPAWMSQRYRMLDLMGRREEANALIRCGVERGLAGMVLFRHVPPTSLPQDLAQSLLQWAESVGPDAEAQEIRVAADVIVALGRPVPARLMGEGEASQEGTHHLSRLDWLKHAPPDGSLKRPVLTAAGVEELTTARSESPETVALVFTGLADRAMVPLPSLDRYLAALDISAVYLRDSSRLLFNRGVPSIAGDFAETVAYLRELLADWGARRLVTIGTSSGGYAAIRYGLALTADKILAFSAPTNLGADFLAADGRARLVARQLQKLPSEVLDIRPFVVAADGQTPIELVYGAGMHQDARHANYLSGAPGVTLHAIDGLDAHDSLVWLARQGNLLSFLRERLF